MTFELLLDPHRPGDLLVLLAARAALFFAVAIVLLRMLESSVSASRRRDLWVLGILASGLGAIATVVVEPSAGWSLSMPASWTTMERGAPVPGSPIPAWIVWIWFGGAAFVWARFGIGMIARGILTRPAHRATAPSWLREAVDRLRSEAGIRRTVRIVVGRRLRSTMTWGVARPVVHLHESALGRPDSVTSVLRHEIEHIRRFDAAWVGVVAFLKGVFWFHPLALHSLRELERAQEESCDDAAVTFLGSPVRYARALADHVEVLRPSRLPMGLAFVRVGELERRVQRVLDPALAGRGRSRAAAGWRFAVGIAVLLGTVVGVQSIGASWTISAAGPPAALEQFGTDRPGPETGPSRSDATLTPAK